MYAFQAIVDAAHLSSSAAILACIERLHALRALLLGAGFVRLTVVEEASLRAQAADERLKRELAVGTLAALSGLLLAGQAVIALTRARTGADRCITVALL